MCYTQRKIEGGVGALRESDDANFLKPNGRSRNLNVYGLNQSGRKDSTADVPNEQYPVKLAR